MRHLALAALFVVATAQYAHSQLSHTDKRFATTTTGVSVDVVVRDRQGRPIVDLRPADFEVYEDGVRQEIAGVRLVTPGSAATPSPAQPPSSGGQTAAAGRVEAATFKAIVFDRLSPEARALAVKGAVASLDSRADDFVGVFLSDLSLETIQTYTNDPARVRRAIEEAGLRATSSFARDGARVGSTAQGDRNAALSPTSGAEFHGPALGRSPEQPSAGPGGNDDATRLIQQMVDRMDRAYQMLVRDQQGLATTNALLAVIEGLAQLPGRKSVVFLAEGLALPTRVMPLFDAVVARANRANVTIYTVDAAGLRTQSATAETARQIQALGLRSMGDAPRLDSSAWSQDFEINEDVLRQDPAVSLTMLAERTGGLLIDNTNNLEPGLRQIDADARSYYLVDYVPKNPAFTGEWRNIAVKVPGRTATVRARSGYLAVHEPGVLPLLSYEGPALAALSASPRPTALPVRANAWSFPAPSGETRVAVLAATPLSSQTFARDGETYRTDFTLLVRIRDAAGEVVRKASQPYRLTGPASHLAAARTGDVLLFRQIALPPGDYTIEYAVHDALARTSGAGLRPVVVHPAGSPGMSVSSLLIVQRTERQPAREGDAPNLLRYGDLLLYPNTGEPISKRLVKALSFYFVVMPAAGAAAPNATLELLQAGKPLAETPIALSAPGSDGAIRHAGQLPLENFPAGRYELRVVLTQGSERQVRAATFNVID